MDFSTYLYLIGIQFVRHLPFLLIGVVGLWYAVPMKPQIARAATWASYGFGLLVVHSLARVAGDVTSIAIRVNTPLEATETGVALTVVSLIAYLPLLGALVLLSRAFFLDRETSGQSLAGRKVVSGAA